MWDTADRGLSRDDVRGRYAVSPAFLPFLHSQTTGCCVLLKIGKDESRELILVCFGECSGVVDGVGVVSSTVVSSLDGCRYEVVG